MLKKLFNIYYEWWKNIDKIIFFLIFFLFLLGLFFSLVSTSIIASEKLNTNSYYFFIKHLIFIAVGSFIFIFLSLLEKKRLIYFCIILFFLCFRSWYWFMGIKYWPLYKSLIICLYLFY